MYLTDYHTHSSMSFDGHAPMADIAAAAERAGLDELCITDHCDFLDEHGRPNRAYDWDGACAQYREALAACKPGFTLRLGLEFGMSHLDPAAAAAICARPEADFILGSIHNLCPEKGGTDLYVVPYPDEAACCAALDDYFASMALLADTDFYDVLAHIIYPLRYMEVPVSLEPYYGRIRAILRTAVEKGRGMEINTCRGHTIGAWKPILELYKSCGGEIVTVGSDAHTPADVGKGIPAVCELLAACGFRYVCTYEKRKPVFHKL